MITSILRPTHSAAASNRRAPTLPMSPRFGKTTIRPPYRNPILRSVNKPAAMRKEDKCITEVMKRLCVTLKKALTPAINGNLRQREKDITDALDRIRLHNLEAGKAKRPTPEPYKPFRGRA
ncbi:hypothetical protein [Luteibacter sp.]|jgi:hypothetical protein|uniref:hypothetical protein n=1 Tax=Luteibacter sp. TaxID=1886636 RepID=UPI002F42E9B2